MLGNIDLIVGIWVYNDGVQIKFTFCSGSMIFDPWNLKFGQIFSCHHFISLWFEILTWFLVWECILISYRSTLKFIPVEWFLANLQLLGFEIWPTISLPPLFFPLWFEILIWFLVCECMVMSYRSSLNFIPIEWCWSNLRTLDF
jgi:hypothetical protein